MVARRDGDVVLVCSDNDVSASSRSRKPRPGYQRLLAAADAGEIDAIVSYSTSRLTRRPLEFEGLIARAEQGLTITVCKTGDLDLNTARGRRRARDDAARDAEYAEENSELLLLERAQRRERGLWNGGARPFGWEADGTTPRPVEQDLIRSACADVLAGRSLSAVARDWTAALGGSPHGADATRSSSVGTVLRNPRIAGLLPDGRPAQWPAIVDEVTYRGVVAALSAPDRRRERGPTRLLTGIGLCGICADGTTVHGGGTRMGTLTYRCSRVQHLDRLAAPVDDWVTRVLLAYLERERVNPRPAAADHLAPLTQTAAALRAKQSEALSMWQADELSRDELRVIRSRIAAELAEVESRMVAASRSAAHAVLGIGDLREAWDAADVDRRRGVLRLSGLQVVVCSPGKGVKRQDDEWLAQTIRIESPDGQLSGAGRR